MAQFNEQQEQFNDQKYLDGFNIGYQLEKQLEDKSLSDKDRKLIESMTNTLKKTQSKNDKIQGMLDGRKERIIEKERQRINQLSKDRSKSRER